MSAQIYELIPAVMADLTAVGKDKRNQQQGFMFRGIDDVMNALKPILTKHRIFTVPEVLEQTREERKTNKGNNILYSLLKMRFSFFAPDGSHVDAVTIGEGMDSGDKASNKAMAIAYKYALFQTFCIPTEEMADPDAETPPPTTPAVHVDRRQGTNNTVTRSEPWTFMAALSEFEKKHDMSNDQFMAWRKAAIDGGIVEDIPSKFITPDKAEELFNAIETNFLS